MQEVPLKRDACGGGGTVDIDDLCSLADALKEEVQRLGQEEQLSGRMQSRLVETSQPEWSGRIKVVSSPSDCFVSSQIGRRTRPGLTSETQPRLAFGLLPLCEDHLSFFMCPIHRERTYCYSGYRGRGALLSGEIQRQFHIFAQSRISYIFD